jgi:hypothetical protein
MSCPNCRVSQLVEIGMNVGENRVTMHSCSRCDTRWWERDGRRVAVNGVLQLATVRR